MIKRLYTLLSIFIFSQAFAKPMIKPFQSEHPLIQKFKYQKNKSDDLCEDLYKYTCLDSKFQSKFSDRNKKLKDNIKKKLSKIKDEIANDIGFDSYKSFMLSQLSDAGLQAWESSEPEKENSLSESLYGFSSYLNYNTKFSIEKSCESIKEKVNTIKNKLPWDESKATDQQKEEAKKALESFKDFKKNTTLYAQSFLKKYPEIMISKIHSACDSMKGSKDRPEICDGNKMDIFLLDIKRNIKSSTIEKLNNFIENNLGQIVGPIFETNLSSTPFKFVKENYLSCNDNISKDLAEHVIEKVNLKIHRSKKFVTDVLSHFYSPELHQNILNEVIKTKESFLKVFEKRFPSSKIVEKALIDISKVSLGWPRLSQKILSFIELDDDFGIELISNDYLHANRFEARKIDFAFYPDLSGFTVINAYYMPETHYGEYRNNEEINFFPALLQLYNLNPWAFRMVLAHEIGHRFDPNLSVINGYDLNPYYQNLLGCWEQPESIMIIRAQYGEAVSDYFSSLVMAQMTELLSKNERKEALVKSVSTHCYLNSSASSFDMSRTHPLSILRVNGIFGGTTEFRDGLGCDQPSGKFINCSL